MAEIPGIIRPELQALPQIKDRMTFLYLERSTFRKTVFPWNGREY